MPYAALIGIGNFIQNLIVRYKDSGLAQVDLAAKARIGRRIIIELESGNASIGLRRLARIFSVLGLDAVTEPSRVRPTESDLENLFADNDEEK